MQKILPSNVRIDINSIIVCFTVYIINYSLFRFLEHHLTSGNKIAASVSNIDTMPITRPSGNVISSLTASVSLVLSDVVSSVDVLLTKKV